MKFFLIFVIAFFTPAVYGDEYKTGSNVRLGEYVPLDLVYTDSDGVTKTLGEFIGNIPAVISVNYFDCSEACGLRIDGMTEVLDRMELTEGRDYKALTISFVKTDSLKDAKLFKSRNIDVLRKDFDKNEWNYLTTPNQKTIDILTHAFGYEYKKVINRDGLADYIHPIGLVVLSPDGQITRYLNGVEYLSFDLKIALLEAAKGEIRPIIARALSFCFSYDPENSKYVLETNKILATIILLIILGVFIYMLMSRKKRKTGDNNE